MTDDPWHGIPRPSDSQSIIGQRVDRPEPWDFFWARDLEGRYVWLMDVGNNVVPHGPVPKLRGVEVQLAPASEEVHGRLMLTLLDRGAKDQFAQLCVDVMNSTADARDESRAVSCALARTWRWHHLLRGAGSGLLSPAEQQGLVGEIVVLLGGVKSSVGLRAAVTGWRGPLGSPKDFELGSRAVEVKARRGMAEPYVTISSEHQLDLSACELLLLAVVDVQPLEPSADEGETLTDFVGRAQQMVEEECPDLLSVLESRVSAAGFRWDDDYTGVRWTVTGEHWYRVDANFPKISAADLPSAVSLVTYRLGLAAVGSYELATSEAYEALRSSHA